MSASPSIGPPQEGADELTAFRGRARAWLEQNAVRLDAGSDVEGESLGGPGGRVADGRESERWARALLQGPGNSIAGGTPEIMRNILGERVLRLPKEPQVDRDIPFRDVKVGGAGR